MGVADDPQYLIITTWTAAWVASVALAAFGPEILWNNQPAPTLAAITISVLVSMTMFFANKRNLQGLDELQRTIQLAGDKARSSAPDWWAHIARRRCSRVQEVTGVETKIGHLIAFMAVVFAWPGASPACCATDEEPAQGAGRGATSRPSGPAGLGAGGLTADRQRHRNGNCDPSLPLAWRLARLFGLSIEDIFQDQAEV